MERTRLEKVVSETADRSHVYGFLSVLYAKEPTDELVQFIGDGGVLECFQSLGFDVRSALGKKTGKKPLEVEDLVLEYTRLFIGPGPHISPHESVHRSDDPRSGFLWGDSTVDVKRFVEWIGLSYSEDYGGIPDHVAVEFELMQRIIEREKTAWREEDEESARRCLEYERKFMKEHLLKWVPDFCERVARETASGFYREMAEFTCAFLRSEDHFIDERLAAISETS